jgi:hypothetical protein
MFDLEFFNDLIVQGLIWEAIKYVSSYYPELEEIIIIKSERFRKIVFSKTDKAYREVHFPLPSNPDPDKKERFKPNEVKPADAKSAKFDEDDMELSYKTGAFDPAELQDNNYEVKFFYSKFPNSFLDNYSIFISEKYELNYERIIDTQINHNQRLYFKVISEIIKTKEIEFMTPIIETSRFYKPLTIKLESQNRKSILTIEMDGEVLNKVPLN